MIKGDVLLDFIKMKNNFQNIKIQNPEKRFLLFWILFDILSLIILFNSFSNFDINSADGLFIMLSFLVIITSLFFIPQVIKNIRLIDGAINNGKMILYWEYTSNEWQEYIKNEKDYRLSLGKLIAFFLYVITALIFIPFIIFITDGKLVLFFVMLLLFVIYTFMGFMLPKIIFLLRRTVLGKVILFEKGVLLNKQFHTWDFPLSKFSFAEHKIKPYNHIAITYDFFDRTGPRSYTVNVPIPKMYKGDIKKIISSFK